MTTTGKCKSYKVTGSYNCFYQFLPPLVSTHKQIYQFNLQDHLLWPFPFLTITNSPFKAESVQFTNYWFLVQEVKLSKTASYNYIFSNTNRSTGVCICHLVWGESNINLIKGRNLFLHYLLLTAKHIVCHGMMYCMTKQLLIFEQLIMSKT